MTDTRSNSMSKHLPEWSWKDDAFVLSSLVAVSAIAIAVLGERSLAPTQAEVTPLPSIDLAEPEPPKAVAAPYAVAASIDLTNALPPSRPLNPDEQISDTPSFVDVFGGRLNTRLWVEHESDRDQWFMANDFRKDRILTDANGLALQIDRHDPESDRPHEWVSGEINSRRNYGYGRYEVFMSPAKGRGLISAFFTYTGPWFGDPHDEIDIEFLGKSTNKIEFNAFRSGRPFGGETLELPFDASEAFHLYAFEWHPDAITWFIDGVPVYRLDAKDHRLPQNPQKIYANIWTGNMPAWHGRAQFEPGVTSRYACTSFQKFGDTSRQCSDMFEAEVPYRPVATAATD